MKDFKDSYDQKAWANAVAEHARMREWLIVHTNAMLVEYANSRISKLENDYPMLKGK